jgi:hypothetical protein
MEESPLDIYVANIALAMVAAAFEAAPDRAAIIKAAQDRGDQESQEIPLGLSEDDRNSIVGRIGSASGSIATIILNDIIKKQHSERITKSELAEANRLIQIALRPLPSSTTKPPSWLQPHVTAPAQTPDTAKPEAPAHQPKREGKAKMAAPHEPTDAPEDNLWKDVLEQQAKTNYINVAYVARKYQETVRDRPLLRLIQDIEQRVGIYTNILEELKRNAVDSPDDPADPTIAQTIRAKYEGLRLVPPGHLPNPWAFELAKHALDKLRTFGAALVEIMAKYAADIKIELKIPVTVSFKIDVSVSLSPSVTLGVADGV